MSRKVKDSHLILLHALKSTDRAHDVLTEFQSEYNPVVRMLETFAELKESGIVDSVDKGNYISWRLTEKGSTLV